MKSKVFMKNYILASLEMHFSMRAYIGGKLTALLIKNQSAPPNEGGVVEQIYEDLSYNSGEHGFLLCNGFCVVRQIRFRDRQATGIGKFLTNQDVLTV